MHCRRRRILRRGLEFHVCTINKVPIRKKSGNLSNDPSRFKGTWEKTYQDKSFGKLKQSNNGIHVSNLGKSKEDIWRYVKLKAEVLNWLIAILINVLSLTKRILSKILSRKSVQGSILLAQFREETQISNQPKKHRVEVGKYTGLRSLKRSLRLTYSIILICWEF